MKFPLFSIIAFLTVELVATLDAALPAEIYWKSMLPNTPMPEVLRDSLHPIGAGTAMPRASRPGTLCKVCHAYISYVRRPGILPNPSLGTPPAAGFLHPSSPPKGQLHYKLNETLFFLEKDLKAGHKMNFLFLQYTFIINHASFLPRHVVKSIPFSSSKMEEILNKFGVKRGSASAELMKNTINICEEPGIKGEDKYCATSLESMVDFVTLKLGRSVKALSMIMMNQTKEEEEEEEEEYTIMQRVKKVGGTRVVCHKLNYVYAVFLCHKLENTVAYTVPLEGANGSRVKAVCVCHRDTSDWNPKHLAFQLLKVKPGTVPVCHLLWHDTVMWIPKQN